MPDSEEYPLHQPQRNQHQGAFGDQSEPELEEERDARSRSRGQGPFHQRESALIPVLPAGRFRKALSIGVVAGGLCTLQNLIIVLINAPTYQKYNPNAHDTVNNALGFTIFGLWALYSFISLIICLIAGFITGRAVVERRMGFLAGFVAGVIYFAIIFLISYIPGYPDHYASSTPANAGAITGGLIFSLILLIVYGIVGGLVSLLGARIATRKHPYYVGEE